MISNNLCIPLMIDIIKIVSQQSSFSRVEKIAVKVVKPVVIHSIIKCILDNIPLKTIR